MDLCSVVMLACVGLVALSAAGANELVVDGAHLGALRAAGVSVHPSVRTVEGRDGLALEFSDGGMECPMGGHLRADAGSIQLWVRTPDNWPGQGRRTLFHVGDEAHVHVTLFCEGGQFRAVYKGGEAHYSSIRYAGSGSWAPGTWHRLEFWWEGAGDGHVVFFLRVDGELAGAKRGKTIERWPERFFVGVRNGRQPWRGVVGDMRVSPVSLGCPEMAPVERTVTVDADRPIGPCYNFWSIRNFTSQHMFPDPEQRERIRRNDPFMKYANCVRFIGGRGDGRNRYFLGVDAEGRPICDFEPMLAYLHGILDGGWTPRIVLDNVPTAMSDPPEMHMYGNTYPPKDYNLYHSYIRGLVQAMVDEFGVGTVRSWRFRVMTEPDLDPGHWAGTKEEYLKLYDFAVDAVTSVIPDADIGPGNILTPGWRWGLDIIDHAAKGKNYCTGEVGTRLRYFSCSWYGAVGEQADSFVDAIRAMRDKLDAYPQCRGLPVEVAEFAVLHDEYGKRLWSGDTTEWAASWLAQIADMVYELDVAQVHMWATTTSGIPMPMTHVLAMLEEMAGGARLAVQVEPATPSGGGVIAVRQDDRILILAYNHRAPRAPKVAETLTLRVRDARMEQGQAWTVSERLVDEEHGGFIREFYADCERAGLDVLPDAPLYGGSVSKRFGRPGVLLLHRNAKKYAQLARPLTVRENAPLAVGDGEVRLTLGMPGHSVRFLEIRPADD